ncbi:MAG: CDP-diacylglycerol--glycerol-3-phosphate 3-phosphatidyltransferase [Polyangiales bacterium]
MAPRSLRDDALSWANFVTLVRIALIPFVLWLLDKATARMCFFAAMVYILSALTDALDGWLARRQGSVSVLGKFLDPLADKLLVMSTLVWLVGLGRVPAWVVILIVGRELSVTALRAIASSEGVVIAAGQGGKEKTALQMVAILLLILHYPYTLMFPGWPVAVDMHQAGLWLIALSLFFAITSAGEYVHLLVRAVEAKDARLQQGMKHG